MGVIRPGGIGRRIAGLKPTFGGWRDAREAGRRESISYRPSLLPSFSIEPASPPLAPRGCYLSISEDQLRMTDKGAELDVSTLVLTWNFCPSDVTS
jgi:hypothetical protein